MLEVSSMNSEKKRPLPLRILRVIGIVIGLLLLCVAGLFAYLTCNEYNPEPVEKVALTPLPEAKPLTAGAPIRLVTWNIGYGALGDNADFFMDGGKGVKTADRARVLLNIQGVMDELTRQTPDIILMQEVDRDSYRSEHIDEMEEIAEYLEASGQKFQRAFACNFDVDFIPYPVPPIGEVKSGIVTLSAFAATDAERISLPTPFTWPSRVGNLKRCLLVTRYPVLDENGGDTGREFVVVNLHLEAYDDGEGKIAQTRQLKGVLDSEVAKGNYVMAAGDFNQVFSGTDLSAYPTYPGNWICGQIEAEDFAGYQLLMDASVPTCRSLDRPVAGSDPDTFQYYMLDGVILSANIRAESITTRDLGFVCSDHNPVILDFVLE
ncbi:MAG: endonuclease [Lachnospiraceae bacterium]|nr:endonuclease [Lachnospiraceae bacterium]